MYNAAGTNNAFINSPQDASNASMLGLNTGSFTYATTPSTTSKHRLFLANDSGIFLETYKVSGGTIVGGQLFLGAGQTQLHHFTGAGVEVASLYMNDAGRLLFLGDLDNNAVNANGIRDTFIAGSASSGLGPQTAFSVTYGATVPARPGVVYAYFSATNTSHRLSAFSTTGFTVTTSASVTANLCYFAYRQ
jgi:hypothetical protein